MRIAQVCPLHESVPPATYGGIERVVHYLVEELVAGGHEVTLFASGDSSGPARLVPCCQQSLRARGWEREALALHLLEVERVLAEAHRFDILHFHLDSLHFPALRRQRAVHLTTLHDSLDRPGIPELLAEFSEAPLVSLSDAARRPAPGAHFVATVPNGIPGDLLRLQPGPGRYLAFLGRLWPEKGPAAAVEIARRAGVPLKLAGKVDPYREEAEPLLREPFVEYLGEVGDAEKQELLGGALALVFPIEWEEPFGLVMIEALACGTPVIAFRRGSVPEVVDHGVTGFVVDDVAGAAACVAEVGRLDRRECRRRFEARFTASRMAREYLEVYRALRRKARAA